MHAAYGGRDTIVHGPADDKRRTTFMLRAGPRRCALKRPNVTEAVPGDMWNGSFRALVYAQRAGALAIATVGSGVRVLAQP